MRRPLPRPGRSAIRHLCPELGGLDDAYGELGGAPGCDKLDQLMKVVSLVSCSSGGKRAREAGLEELFSAPVNHCLQCWALRWHVPFLPPVASSPCYSQFRRQRIPTRNVSAHRGTPTDSAPRRGRHQQSSGWSGPVSRKTWIAGLGESTCLAAPSLRVQPASGCCTSSVVKKIRLAVVTTYW